MKITPEKKAAIRHKLLEEASRHFASKGFRESNINEISLGAGYAKGTIYNYFSSKEDLFGQVIEEAVRRTVQNYRSANAHDSIRDALRELARADVSVLREEESFMKVLVSEAMNPISENYEAIMGHLGTFVGMITEILDQGFTRGEIRSDKPASQLALVFLGMLTLFYVQHWKSDGSWPTLEEIPDLVVTLFVDGVRGQPPDSSGGSR